MKILSYFIIFCVIAIPLSGILPISRSEAVWFSQYIALLFLSFIGASIVIWRFNKYLALLTAYCVYSAFFVSGIQPRAVICVMQILLGIGTIYAVSRFNEIQRKRVIISFTVITFLYFILLVLQSWNKDPFFMSTLVAGGDELVGFSGAKDQLGAFFALTGIPLLSFTPVLSVLTLAGLYVAKSSFAFAAYIAATLLFLFLKKSKYLFLVICLCIIGLTTYVKTIDKVSIGDLETRFGVWKSSINSTIKGKIEYYPNLSYLRNQYGKITPTQEKPIVIKTNVFKGFGIGNFLRIFPHTAGDKFNYYDEKFIHAHNDYVEGFFELGLIGIILFGIWLINLFRRIFKSPMTKEKALYLSCFVAYLISATGNFITHLAVSGFFLCVFIGLLEGSLKNGLSSTPSQRA